MFFQIDQTAIHDLKISCYQIELKKFTYY